MMDKDIIKDARERFDYATSQNIDNVKDAAKASRFVDGDQWPESIKRQRELEERPCLTNNKLRKFVYQVMGEIQQNKPVINIVPSNIHSNPIFANIRDYIIKDIEKKSDANDSYDNAILQTLEGGYGAWRIVTEFADNESFDQEARIIKIPNRFSVVMDPDSQSKVYEDSEYGFVTTIISKEDAKRKFGKNTIIDFEAPMGDDYNGWISDKNIRIAEYFYKEYKKKKILKLKDGTILDLKEFNDLKEIYPEISSDVINERTIQVPTIKWCKLSYDQILEPVRTFPGKYIPIIMCVGYEHNDEGLRRFRGLVHDALDPMMMYNFWKTHATELVALAPKTPFIISASQIKGFEKMWIDVNKVPTPYLLHNDIPNTQKPSREPASHIPAATINEINMSAAEIQDVIGMYAPSLGEPSNERSGRAILARQAQANNTIFTFINNFQKSLLYTSKILLNIIPEIYTSTQVMNILGMNGLQELYKNNNNLSIDQGAELIEFDLENGKYDVESITGPNFATKRQQTTASMLDFLQIAPQAAPIIAPRLARSMDWEGSQTIAQELQQLYTGQPNTPTGTQPTAVETRTKDGTTTNN